MRRSISRLASWWILAVIFTGRQSAAAPRYILSDLGDVSASVPLTSHGYSINASGQVAGYGLGFGYDHAFIWTPHTPNGTTGSLLDLSDYPYGMGITQAMNDFGQVAGLPGGPWTSLLFTPNAPRGSSGHVTDLGDLPGGVGSHFPYGINSFGQVAGGCAISGNRARACLWTPTVANGDRGAWKDLGSLPGINQANAKAINARGQVTGSAFDPGFGSHAIVWNPSTPNGTTGTMTDIGTLGGDLNTSTGLAINAAGQIAGFSGVSVGNRTRAFLWTPSTPNGASGSMIDLGVLPGEDSSFAWGMNNLGYVVGDSSHIDSSFNRAMLWTAADGMMDLNSLLVGDYPGWKLYSGESINDFGQITGVAIYDPDGPGGIDSYPRAFVLTPVPEPGAILLMVFTAAVALRRRGSFIAH